MRIRKVPTSLAAGVLLMLTGILTFVLNDALFLGLAFAFIGIVFAANVLKRDPGGDDHESEATGKAPGYALNPRKAAQLLGVAGALAFLIVATVQHVGD